MTAQKVKIFGEIAHIQRQAQQIAYVTMNESKATRDAYQD